MILQPAKKRRAPEDDSLVGMRLSALMIGVLVLFGVLAFRLWFLQVLSGDEYLVYANDNRERTVRVEAPRGVIYDRNYQSLVENRAGLSIGLLPMDMEDAATEISQLAKLLQVPRAQLWDEYQKAKDDPYVVRIVEEDVPETPVVTYLKEHALDFPGVKVEESYLRSYPEGAFAAHLLGYVGEIGEADLQQEEFATLKAGAQIGKDGVERTYDSFLRGNDGYRTVEVDAAGRPKQYLEDVAPTPGNNLVLTIDADLQDAAEKAIVEGIERAHADGFRSAAAGAVVALDPRNGQILAMASYPDYDPSLWVGGMSTADYQALTAEGANNPLFNRAIKGLYPAASTFKPFVASTALRTDLLASWDTKFMCDGSFKVGAQKWKCWNTDGHGELNLIEGLMESCDVYFYNVGKMFYEQQGPVLQDGLKKDFGFGSRTGIDLPDEYQGRVPDKDWKREYYAGHPEVDRLWKTGDEVNLAIGQGDLLVTPLQMAVAMGALANARKDPSGAYQATVYVPQLGMQITDASGNVIHQFESEPRSQFAFNEEDLSVIRKGLYYVTSEHLGTAYRVFYDFPYPVAGKTGTAEKKPDDDYAWFVAYAPYYPIDSTKQPEIVVAALVEQGGHGSSVAAPVVRRVLEEYFHTEAGTIEPIQATE